VHARITVPASRRNAQVLVPIIRTTSRIRGARYGGSSITNGRRLARSGLTTRASTHAAASDVTRLNPYIPTIKQALGRQPADGVAGEQRGDHQRVHRQPGRAGHQRDHQHRQDAIALALHRARRHHRRHRAREPRQHRDERAARQLHRPHDAVHQVRDPRQVAEVLEQPEEEEQQQDLRQEHDHRADAADHAVGA
jgi:hypothetical protein